jgi:hypothetical protein
LAQKKEIGEVAILKKQDRFVYYLITKEKYWNKPTYEDLQMTLDEMKKHAVANNVPELCMPRYNLSSNNFFSELAVV